MSRNVKRAGPRQYDSSRRQAHARERRAAVLRAALDRFLEQGYSSTTIAQVAGDADVSVETVYKTFGNKAGLLKAVFDVAVAGDDEPVPMVERDDIQRVIAEPDGRGSSRSTSTTSSTPCRAPHRCSSWCATRPRPTTTRMRSGSSCAASNSKR